MVLLVAGIVASLLKGFDYEEAILLALVLAALLPCRRQFFRRASLLDEPFSVEWIAAILLVVVGIGWLLLFSYKHVEYSRELWWQFELSGDAPRSLRARSAAMLLLALIGGWRLLRPVAPGAPRPDARRTWRRSRPSSARSRRSSACLALLGDKRLPLRRRPPRLRHVRGRGAELGRARRSRRAARGDRGSWPGASAS